MMWYFGRDYSFYTKWLNEKLTKEKQIKTCIWIQKSCKKAKVIDRGKFEIELARLFNYENQIFSVMSPIYWYSPSKSWNFDGPKKLVISSAPALRA